MYTFFGFQSIGDFAMSLTGFYSQQSFILNTLTTSLLFMTTFVTNWIYPDPIAITVLVAALLGDWGAGMVRGAKSTEGWKTGLALRIFPKIAVYGLILAGISQGYGEIASAIFYSGIMGITLVSLGKNAAVLGWIEGSVADFLQKYVDEHKNFTNENKNDKKLS
jgi:hypothetical protein